MVVLVTKQWSGLGLALLMARQESEVVCAYDYRGLQGKELNATEQCGEGLVEKVPFTGLTKRLADDPLFVFDGNDFPREAEQLQQAGHLVIGTSRIGQRLEDDREFAIEIARQVGFPIPESQEFTAYEPALAWLKERSDKAYVYKPDKQNPTLTYVPLDQSDPERANQELQQYIESFEHVASPKFVLQEVVQGIEANVELWVRHGEPILALLDLESKRKLVGELGENIGCAGDYVQVIPLDAPLVQQTAAKYLAWPELQDYTGSVDVNVMITEEGQAFFLENCFRFGYNAYPVLFQSLARAPMEVIMREWVSGSDDVRQYFSEAVGGSLTLVMDHPQMGMPILIPPEARDSTYLYRAYQTEHGLAMVDQWPEIACVTALGSSIPEAGALCLERAEAVDFPGKGYRIDLANDDQPKLPAARLQALQEMGLLGAPVEAE